MLIKINNLYMIFTELKIKTKFYKKFTKKILYITTVLREEMDVDII